MFQDNIDPDDPEYITLFEAFRERFKEHGFTPSDMAQYDECSKILDEVLEKLAVLQRKNLALLKKYNNDSKFVRVHKRIKEENEKRKAEHKKPIVDEYDDSILDFLKGIKTVIDQKVYDKNDILRKDEYFEQTVMAEIQHGFQVLNFKAEREDRLFIRDRIAKQYLIQYNSTYPAA
jgi:type I restriction enzyme R subunit